MRAAIVAAIVTLGMTWAAVPPPAAAVQRAMGPASLGPFSVAGPRGAVRMVAPLIPISYEPQKIHFEPAPPSIAQYCHDLVGRELWVYASFTTPDTKYFVVSGYLVDRPDGRGPVSIEPDPTGVAVALRGSQCTTDAADWVMSGEVPKGTRLPETDTSILPGHNAPRVCDKYGSCHYEIPSRHAYAILDGLAANALQRFSQAFGGQGPFLAEIRRSVRHPDLIAPILKDRLALLKK